jgi:2-methylcitrate dehydratase PrpD
MTSITHRIATFTSALAYDAIPAAVQEKAKVSLLHNLGVALAGEPLLGASVRYAQALGEQGPSACARLLLNGRAATPETAAFANAALMHARAQDDVYFPGLTHVGAIISPAVLAVGEQLGSSGRDMLVALVAGYEAASAISQGFAKRTTARGFRASGIYGVFGAAAAVARLLQLDARASANAIGIAASMSAGTNQTWVAGTQEWQFQVGLAARNGILAARLAEAGGTGAPEALEGVAGFYAAFLGDREQLDAVGQDLGQTWRSLDVTYKPYAVCAILQEPVRQAMELARSHALTASDINAVRLTLNPAEAAYPGTNSTGPFQDTGATLMSAQFCLAVALSGQSFKGVDLTRFDDPQLLSLVHQSSVHADPQLGVRSFVLEVDLARGSTLRHASHATTEPFNWDRAGVVSNLRAMADEMPVDEKALHRLITTVLAAEQHAVADIVSACVLEAGR